MLKLVPRYERRLFDSAALCLMVVVIGILAGCGSGKEVTPPPPPGVVVTDVVQKDVPIYQEWVGTMNGNTNADIRPKVEGFLLKQLYEDGAYVKTGQPLFRLDSRQTQASVEQSQGNLERARAAL